MLRIGYLGPAGTHSEDATLKLCDSGAPFVLFDTLEDVIAALRGGDVDGAVVPLWNSIAGVYSPTMGSLEQHAFSAPSVTLGIRHCLAIHRDAEVNKIKKIRSYHGAFDQCSDALGARYSTLARCDVGSTSRGAEQIKVERLLDVATICSERCARECYDLKIIDDHIQNAKPNFTVFLLLRQMDLAPLSLGITRPQMASA